MSDINEEDDLLDLGGLFDENGGEDLLSLLDSVQKQQDGVEEAEAEVIPSALDNVAETMAAVGSVSSEDAFQKLMGSLNEEEEELLADTDFSEDAVRKRKMEEYDKAVYGFAQLDEIEKGIRQGLDVSLYDSEELSFRQMREVRIGLEQGIDATFYANKYYKDSQMREIRLGLMEGLDVSGYARLIYSLPDMERMRRELFKERYKEDPDSMDFSLVDMDTGLMIRTTGGLMRATIQLTKPLPGNFSKKNLETRLRIYGIEYGYNFDALGPDLGSLPLEEEFLVAEGTAPEEGKDGWYEYFVDNLDDSRPSIKEDGSIDYRAKKEYSATHPGEKVALYHPATQGKMGYNVKGIEITAHSGRNIPRLDCSGVRLLPDSMTYVSMKEGYITLKNGKLVVVEYLEFQGDVAYGNGNISFDGTVHVTGSVRENVIIEATGDIQIDGFVENALLKAGRDIIIRRGVNGNGKGRLEARRNVVAAFFENVTVVAGGNVEGGYILDSMVFSNEMIHTEGKKNLICGGKVHAIGGIITGTIGNPTQVRTEVEAGRVTDTTEKLRELLQRKRKLDLEMDKVRAGMNTVLQKMGALKGRTNSVFLKFQEVLERQKEEMRQIRKEQEMLESGVADSKRVYIKATNGAHENTKVTVNGATMILREDITRPRFYNEGKKLLYDHSV
ncbi:MAG: DUF342 domain-containing protein [Lachnospiraceae bacterium]|nr:DUF342 domain-containing protein [Lachnospiraceae bacterium]MBO6299976.1 DUF342 domain-containing protein [Lachnospiraceae bacterium]